MTHNAYHPNSAAAYHPSPKLDDEKPVIEVTVQSQTIDGLRSAAVNLGRDFLGDQPDLCASLIGRPPEVVEYVDEAGIHLVLQARFQVGSRYRRPY
jgi:hypothetical protein